jgi:hypothetical protein
MKELFNILSNVSEFLTEKRFVYNQETPKEPVAPGAENRKEQAENQKKYLIPKERELDTSARSVQNAPGIKFSKMEVSASKGKIPAPHLIFGSDTPRLKINDDVYAERGKDGKYYEFGTKNEVVLKPGDILTFPQGPETNQKMIAEARKRAGEDLLARAMRGAMDKKKVGPTFEEIMKEPERQVFPPEELTLTKKETKYPEPMTTEERLKIAKNARKPKQERQVAEPLKIEYKEGVHYRVAKAGEKVTEPYVYIEKNGKQIAVNNNPEGFTDANGKKVNVVSGDKILIPLKNEQGELMASYTRVKAGGKAGAVPETPTMYAGGKTRRPRQR